MKSNFKIHSFSFLDERHLIICAVRVPNTLVAGNDLLPINTYRMCQKFKVTRPTSSYVIIKRIACSVMNLRITFVLKLFRTQTCGLFSEANFILTFGKLFEATIAHFSGRKKFKNHLTNISEVKSTTNGLKRSDDLINI